MRVEGVATVTAVASAIVAFMSFAVAITSLRFSRLTYRAGLPRLQVQGGWFDVVEPGQRIAVFMVEAINVSRVDTEVTNVWLELPQPLWRRLLRRSPDALMPIGLEIGSSPLPTTVKASGHRARFLLPQRGLQAEYDARTRLRPIVAFADNQHAKGAWVKRAAAQKALTVRHPN